jgi:diaminopimelate decarboxylase
MAPTCADQPAPCDSPPADTAAPPLEAPLAVLREIVRRFGTPVYAYDIARIRVQVGKLRTFLPRGVEVLYSLKANPSLGLCGVLAGCGLGADVASAGEIVTARAAGFPPERLFLTIARRHCSKSCAPCRT